jgi:uncharacterized protein YbjT (DUF2867 family)
MTSLIIGGAGFLGAQVVRTLVQQDENTVVFSRNPANNQRLSDVRD